MGYMRRHRIESFKQLVLLKIPFIFYVGEMTAQRTFLRNMEGERQPINVMYRYFQGAQAKRIALRRFNVFPT